LRAICKLAGKFDKDVWFRAVPIINNLQILRATTIEKILKDVETRERINAAKSTRPQTAVAGSALQRSLNAYMEVLKHDREH
jgi:hypothetical protein